MIYQLGEPVGCTIGMMLRSGYAASVARPSLQIRAKPPTRSIASIVNRKGLGRSSLCLAKQNRPVTLSLAAYKPLSTSLVRRAGPYDKIDKKHEEKVEQEKIVPHPDQVSTTSSVHQVFHEQGVPDPDEDVDMLADVKSDLVGQFRNKREKHVADCIDRELSNRYSPWRKFPGKLSLLDWPV